MLYTISTSHYYGRFLFYLIYLSEIWLNFTLYLPYWSFSLIDPTFIAPNLFEDHILFFTLVGYLILLGIGWELLRGTQGCSRFLLLLWFTRIWKLPLFYGQIPPYRGSTASSCVWWGPCLGQTGLGLEHCFSIRPALVRLDLGTIN